MAVGAEVSSTRFRKRRATGRSPGQFLYLHALRRYGPPPLGRRIALDRRPDPPHGLLRRLGRRPFARRSRGCRGRDGWSPGVRETEPFTRVTERGRRRIEELSPRIYGPVIEWDGRWRLLTYAIGEAHRKPPRATAQGTERAGLGAALADSLDIALRHARRRPRGGRARRRRSKRSIFLRASTEDR